MASLVSPHWGTDLSSRLPLCWFYAREGSRDSGLTPGLTLSTLKDSCPQVICSKDASRNLLGWVSGSLDHINRTNSPSKSQEHFGHRLQGLYSNAQGAMLYLLVSFQNTVRNLQAAQNSALWTRVVHFHLSSLTLMLWSLCCACRCVWVHMPEESFHLCLPSTRTTSLWSHQFSEVGSGGQSQDFTLAQWALRQLSHAPALDFLRIYKPKLLLL